jgi:hypothetical protein
MNRAFFVESLKALFRLLLIILICLGLGVIIPFAWITSLGMWMITRYALRNKIFWMVQKVKVQVVFSMLIKQTIGAMIEMAQDILEGLRRCIDDLMKYYAITNK